MFVLEYTSLVKPAKIFKRMSVQLMWLGNTSCLYVYILNYLYFKYIYIGSYWDISMIIVCI